MAGCCPTEEFVLAAAKSSSLESIEELDLRSSNIDAVDVNVFSRLKSLKKLCLSDNELSGFPETLTMRSVKELDITDNKFISTSFLKQFPKLEDVYLEGNPLGKDEKYLAAMKSESLKYIDDTSVDTLECLIEDFKDRLRCQIEGVWAAGYDDDVRTENKKDVQQRFLQDLRRAKLEGPVSDLPKVLNFVKMKLGAEHLKRVFEESNEPASKKRRIAALNNSLVASNKARQADEPEILVERSPNKSAKKPRTPSKDRTNPNQGQKTPSKKIVASKTYTSKQLQQRPKKQLPSSCDYDPQHFLRCHFGGTKKYPNCHPKDNETAVWRCLFEPDPRHPGKETGIVATCGGNMVCLMDVSTGRIVKRFKRDKAGGQNFFAIAWTTVSLESGGRKWPTNVLAVGGINGEVTLLHPDQLMSYDEYSINPVMATYCTALCFHPNYPTILFCGDDTGRFISVWDIGLPKETKKTASKKLCQFKMNGTSTNEIVFCQKTNSLIVACHGGIFAWTLGKTAPSKNRDTEFELMLPTPKGKVDGLAIVGNDLAACKVVKHGCIYLWRPSAVLGTTAGTRKHPVRRNIQLLAVLNWSSTDDIYLNLSGSNGLLTCGDDRGRLWVYNIARLLSSKKEHEELLEPSRILEWPECDTTSKGENERLMTDVNDPKQDVVVTSTALSSDSRYLVATTMNNMVCSWKQVED